MAIPANPSSAHYSFPPATTYPLLGPSQKERQPLLFVPVSVVKNHAKGGRNERSNGNQTEEGNQMDVMMKGMSEGEDRDGSGGLITGDDEEKKKKDQGGKMLVEYADSGSGSGSGSGDDSNDNNDDNSFNGKAIDDVGNIRPSLGKNDTNTSPISTTSIQHISTPTSNSFTPKPSTPTPNTVQTHLQKAIQEFSAMAQAKSQGIAQALSPTVIDSKNNDNLIPTKEEMEMSRAKRSELPITPENEDHGLDVEGGKKNGGRKRKGDKSNDGKGYENGEKGSKKSRREDRKDSTDFGSKAKTNLAITTMNIDEGSPDQPASPSGAQNGSTPDSTACVHIPPKSQISQPINQLHTPTAALAPFNKVISSKPFLPSPLGKVVSAFATESQVSANGDGDADGGRDDHDVIEVDDADEDEVARVDVVQTRENQQQQQQSQMIIDSDEEPSTVPAANPAQSKVSGSSSSRSMGPPMTSPHAASKSHPNSVNPADQFQALMTYILSQQNQGVQQVNEVGAGGTTPTSSKSRSKAKQSSSRKGKKASSSSNKKDPKKRKQHRRNGRARGHGSDSDDSDDDSDSDINMDSDPETESSEEESTDSDEDDGGSSSDSDVELVDAERRRMRKYSKKELKRRDKERRNGKYSAKKRAKSSKSKHSSSAKKHHDKKKSQKDARRLDNKSKGKQRARTVSPSSASISSHYKSLDGSDEQAQAAMQIVPSQPLQHPPPKPESIPTNPTYSEQSHPKLVVPEDHKGDSLAVVIWNDRLHTMDHKMQPKIKWDWLGETEMARQGDIGFINGGTIEKKDDNGEYIDNEYFEECDEPGKGILWRAKLTLVLPPMHPSLKEHSQYAQLPQDMRDPSYLDIARRMDGVREYSDDDGESLRGNSLKKVIQLAVSLNVISWLTCCSLDAQCDGSKTDQNKLQWHIQPSAGLFAPGNIPSPNAMAAPGKLDFISPYLGQAPKKISRERRKEQERLMRLHNLEAMQEHAPLGEVAEKVKATLQGGTVDKSALQVLQSKPSVKMEFPIKREWRQWGTPAPTHDENNGYRGMASRDALSSAVTSNGYRGIASLTHPVASVEIPPATAPAPSLGYAAFGSGGGSSVTPAVERRLIREARLLARHQATVKAEPASEDIPEPDMPQQQQRLQQPQAISQQDAEGEIMTACRQMGIKHSVKWETTDRGSSLVHLTLTAPNFKEAVYSTIEPLNDPLAARSAVHHIAHRAGVLAWIYSTNQDVLRPVTPAKPPTQQHMPASSAAFTAANQIAQGSSLPQRPTFIPSGPRNPAGNLMATNMGSTTKGTEDHVARDLPPHLASPAFALNQQAMQQPVEVTQTDVKPPRRVPKPLSEEEMALISAIEADPLCELKALCMNLTGYIPVWGHEWIDGKVRVWVRCFGKNYSPKRERYDNPDEGYEKLAIKVLKGHFNLKT